MQAPLSCQSEMPTRRTYVALGVGFVTSLAGCTVSVENPLNSDGETEETERESAAESTPTSRDENEEEPSADFSILDMEPLDGYQVSVRVEVGDADVIRIVNNEQTLKDISEDGRHQIAGGDDDEDAPLHYEEVDFGDEFYAFAYYEDEFEPTVELASTRAV